MLTCIPPPRNLCRRTRTALARSNPNIAIVAEEASKAVRKGRPAGWGGGPDGLAGLVVGGGWIFRVKNVLE